MLEEDDYDEGEPEANPLLMPAGEFAAWLSSRGIEAKGSPPSDPLRRASILLELERAGEMNILEIKQYLGELGLTIPIKEN
jgi:hypothetical protein